MSKLLCPKCMKSVTIPDGFSGKEVTCPSCLNTFDAPTRYNPTVLADPAIHSPPTIPTPSPSSAVTDGSPAISTPLEFSTKSTEKHSMSSEDPVDRPLPPPGLVPTPPSLPHVTSSLESTTLPVGYTKSRAITISPRVVAWLPSILLTFTLVCTFFSWVGTYLVGGSPVDTQGLWRAISGYPSRNIPLEGIMQIPPEWADKVKSDGLLMVPFFLLFLVAFAVAWLDRFSHAFDPHKVPQLLYVWQRKREIIAITATTALFLMLIQMSYGFGMERALKQLAFEKFSSEREADAGSPSKLEVVKEMEFQEYKKFNVERTSWLYLGTLCLCLAVLAVLCRFGLERRGSKPPPRIIIQY